MKNKKILIAALILVIVSLVGFIVFGKYSKNTLSVKNVDKVNSELFTMEKYFEEKYNSKNIDVNIISERKLNGSEYYKVGVSVDCKAGASYEENIGCAGSQYVFISSGKIQNYEQNSVECSWFLSSNFPKDFDENVASCFKDKVSEEGQVFSDKNILVNYFKNKGYGKLVSLKLNNKFVDNIENDNISLYTGGIDNGCIDGFCGDPTFVAVVSENAKSVIYFESTIGDFECKEMATIKNENVRNYIKENFCGI